MILALQPSYWQHVLAGLVVIVPTLLVGGFLLGWLVRSVLVPRAAGRLWPEGARGVRPLVEIVVDTQRRPVADDDADGSLVWIQAVRFGLVVAACAVIPLSTGLVLAQPGFGLYLLPLVLCGDAFVADLGRRSGPDPAWVLRVGLAGVVAMAAGVVHAQWGTASVAGVVVAQANGTIGGTDVWGLPTFAVHPLTCALAIVACAMTISSMSASSAHRSGGPIGLVARLVDQAWIVAMAAWLVAAFAGGGAVPWSIDNPGTRHAVSVGVFLVKALLVTVGLAWARATWPTVRVRAVRMLLAVTMVIGPVTIGVTLLLRHLV